MNEKKSPEKTLPDVQSRIENLLWAVSGDYELDIPVDLKAWEKSPDIALYEAVRQGIFQKYYDVEQYQDFFAQKVSGFFRTKGLSGDDPLCAGSFGESLY